MLIMNEPTTSPKVPFLQGWNFTKIKIAAGHKELLATIEIDNNWQLNHWGSSCASIQNGKMIFTGLMDRESDGSHVDLLNLLELNERYIISCSAKSSANTSGKFQLWCHDGLGNEPSGEVKATPYKTPSQNGEIFEVTFSAKYNRDIRIHLQYMPGTGKIEVENIEIYKLKK